MILSITETRKIFECLASHSYHRVSKDMILNKELNELKNKIGSNNPQDLKIKLSNKNYFCDSVKVVKI